MESKKLAYKRKILKIINSAGLTKLHEAAKETHVKTSQVFKNSILTKELKKFAKAAKKSIR